MSRRQLGGDVIDSGHELRQPDALDPRPRVVETTLPIGAVTGTAETRFHQRFVAAHVGQEQDGLLGGEPLVSALEPDACFVRPTGERAQHRRVPTSVGVESAEVGLEHLGVQMPFQERNVLGAIGDPRGLYREVDRDQGIQGADVSAFDDDETLVQFLHACFVVTERREAIAAKDRHVAGEPFRVLAGRETFDLIDRRADRPRVILDEPLGLSQAQRIAGTWALTARLRPTPFCAANGV